VVITVWLQPASGLASGQADPRGRRGAGGVCSRVRAKLREHAAGEPCMSFSPYLFTAREHSRRVRGGNRKYQSRALDHIGLCGALSGILLATNQAIEKPEGPAPAHPAAAAKPSAPVHALFERRSSGNEEQNVAAPLERLGDREHRGQDAEPHLARLNATMGSPATRRYGLPRADWRVADLVPVALHEQGMALLTVRVRLPIAKGEAPCSR
jgi:hypothetical protein